MKTQQKTAINRFKSNAKSDAEQMKYFLKRQSQTMTITEEIKKYTKQGEESSSSFRHFLDKSENTIFKRHQSSTIVKTLYNSPSVSENQSIAGKQKEISKTPLKQIQKHQSQTSFSPVSRISFERIDTSGLQGLKFDCQSQRSQSTISNELLSQALVYLNIGNVQRSMKQLAPLLNVNSTDRNFKYQVIGALFQCSKILKDADLCLHYSQMYVDNLEGENLKHSAFEIDILMYQLRQRLKKIPFLNSKSVEFIVQLLNLFCPNQITEQQHKHKISLLFKYLIVLLLGYAQRLLDKISINYQTKFGK